MKKIKNSEDSQKVVIDITKVYRTLRQAGFGQLEADMVYWELEYNSEKIEVVKSENN